MPSATRITSRQHPVVGEFRRAAARARPVAPVLLDGEHLLREALDAGLTVRVVLGDGRYPQLLERAERAGATVHLCARTVLDAASPVRTPSGIVALADWTPAGLSAVFDTQPALVIGLVDVQDPGNVGSVVRSSHALGATGVVAVGATADPGGWKLLRGSMGSAFRLPVARGDLGETLAAARRARVRVVATTPTGGRLLPEADLRSPALVLFGHEGLGLPPEATDQADDMISIPMRPDVESLNIAVAAALVLDEARRQREAAHRQDR